MRIVALFAIPLLVFAAIPASAGPMGPQDQCDDQVYTLTEEGTTCLRFSTYNAPEEFTDRAGEHVFLWLGVPEAKLSDSTNAITGTPSIVGILYGDTNGAGGLQREKKFTGGSMRPADAALLI